MDLYIAVLWYGSAMNAGLTVVRFAIEADMTMRWRTTRTMIADRAINLLHT